jgi:cysteine-rich repeat protein
MEFFCGDAVCDTAHAESCERCPADCCPDCGDGVLGGIEQCDDGNNVAGDGCSPGCIDEDGTPECGNGLWELGETCDDGNTDDADGCSASCQVEFDCGDGVCDAANHETCLLCAQDCCPDCGNGVIDPGEQCDETAFGPHTCESLCFGSGTLACNAGCQLDTSACVALPDVCGDHTVACGEACDLENLDGQTCQSLGFASGTLACDTSCGFDLAGCSDRRFYLSETFEGGAVPAGWSTSGLWEVGTPTGPGPGAAHGGTACAGTKLDGDYAQPCAYLADWLQTPVIDLSAATAPRLLFRLWIDAAAGTDGANLWFSLDGGLSFQPLPASTILFPAYDGAAVGGHPAWSSRQASRGWQPVLVDLAPFAGSRLVLRFAFRADGSDNAYPGAYVDDVLVAEAARIPVEITTRDPLPSAATGHAYAAPLEAFGGAGGYVWTVVDGSNIDWIERDAGTGEIAGGVLTGTPDASDVGPAWITIRAEAQGDAANANERTFDLEVVQALCFTDFEGALPAGWTLPQAMPPMIPAVWEWGTPSVVGPAACHSGTGCLGTVMAANYPTATCLATLCAAASPPIDLSTSTAPVLTYWQWIDFAAVDGGYLGIDGEVVTAVDPPYNGSVTDMLGTVTPVWIGDLSNLGWHRVTVDLTPYAGSSIQVSFAIANATASTDPGWYVDDFMVID